MWLLSQIQLIALLSYTVLGLYIFARNPNNQLNRSLSLFVACLAVWSVEQYSYSLPIVEHRHLRLINAFGALGWIGMCPAFLWFIQIFTGQNKSPANRWFLRTAVALGGVLFIAQIRGQMVGNYTLMPYGWFNSWSMTKWAIAFFIYYPMLMIAALFLLRRYIRRASDVTRKNQATMLFVFTLLGLTLVTITDVIASLYNYKSIPPIGNALCLIWAVQMGYSIAKHQFLIMSPATAAENIINNMSDLLILTDTEGYIARVNKAAESCLGMGRYNLEGRHISEIFEKDEINKDLFRTLRQLENQRLDLKTHSGLSVPAILSRSPLKDGEKQIGNVLLIKDLSSLQDAEKALKISETRFQELVETINEVVFSVDARGKSTYLSPSFQSLLGLKTTDHLHSPIEDLIHPDDQALFREELGRLFSGNISITRYRLLKNDGQFCWVQASCKPLMVDGRVMGVNGIFTDITEQVKAQDEKKTLMARLAKAEKMEAIGTLAGAVAHDLNNVLSGVVSYPDLLLHRLPDDRRLKKMVETIKASGQKAAAIVEDLLTLSRRGVITTEVVDLNQIIERYLASAEFNNLKSSYPHAGVSVELAEDLHCILGSPVHLDKTFMNLLVNAFEALPPEGGRITIETRNGRLDKPALDNPHPDNSDDWVILKIKDTGLGIAPEDQARIFEPFFTRKVMGRSGTGLGMAVVWGAVQDHNGYVDLKSRLGKGTEFILYFPATEHTKAPERAIIDIDNYLGQGETILVVDDVDTQLQIATDILIRLNYKVQAASSGEKAVEYLKNNPMDLVILDMIMDPGMDGLETFRQINRIWPDQKVIIASGFSEHERIRRALEEGVITCIKKPYLLNQIGTAIHTALRNGSRSAS